jgi:Kef-type K+ transport system membrane component KefB
LLGGGLTAAIVVGLVLSLSSTAVGLQLLAERGELPTRHGRAAFATLLFQDLAVVPLLAVIPLLGQSQATGFDPVATGTAVGVLVVVVVGGGWLLKQLLHYVAASNVREILTACALLTVLGTAWLLDYAGLSMALGAFIAGVLLADSEFRHLLEADIEPFKSLLLGLFFLAVGMSMNMGLLVVEPVPVVALALGLVAVKFAVMYTLGRVQGLDAAAARKLGILLAQGGEFAFVVFGVAVAAGVLGADDAERWILIVSISMLVTPIALAVNDRSARSTPAAPFETPEDDEPRVIIAGFGRFGQITARILSALGIRFTALDNSLSQVDFVRGYGHRIYYGDAARLDLLEAAGADRAELFVLAIDDPEASLRVAELVRRQFPKATIHARARNRRHAYQLMDLGVEHVERDTFRSALHLTSGVLEGLGLTPSKAKRSVATFEQQDLRRLNEHRAVHGDELRMRDLAISAARELEDMFRKDVAEGRPAGERVP